MMMRDGGSIFIFSCHHNLQSCVKNLLALFHGRSVAFFFVALSTNKKLSKMLRAFSSTLVRSVKTPAMSTIGVRAFSEKLSIPTDKEQQTGRRKEELDAESSGDVGFNNEPIVPPSNAGTKENPIMVRQDFLQLSIYADNCHCFMLCGVVVVLAG